MDRVEPPLDPDQWTDEKWLEWLKATDRDEPEESLSEVVQRIAQSTPGLVIGQAMIGMAQAIYGRQDDEIVIMVEGSGQTMDDEPFAVRLDFEHPERSFVDFKSDAELPT